MKRSTLTLIGLLCGLLFLVGCQKDQSDLSNDETATLALLEDPTSTTRATLSPTASYTPEPSPSATETVSPGLVVNASMVFLGETIPDGSSFRPGESFTKSWTLKNAGAVPWSEGYQLVMTGSLPEGQSLNSPQTISITNPVLPGETTQISVGLTAPQQEGQYTVYYQLADDKGEVIPATTIWVTVAICDSGIACAAGIPGGSSNSSGITISLSEFTYTRDTTTITICMDLPNRNFALDYAPTLYIDQKTAPFLEGGSSEPWNCIRLVYQAGATEIEQAERVILDISASVRMSPPKGDPNEACEAARLHLMGLYPGLDFQCNFSMAGYYTNLKLPSGLKREDAQQIIFDAIEGAIYGPWTLVLK